MDTTRTIKKVKGGVQDLLLGKGRVLQERAGGTYEIDRLDVPITVDSIAEMEALDTEHYTRARVYADEVTFDDYIYSAADTKWHLSANSVLSVGTIADLRNLEPTVDGQQINLLGHTVAGVGGGVFYYDASDTTSADNNGTIIITSSGKRWKRKLTDRVPTVLDFGALGKGAGFPDSEAFQNAANNGNFHIPRFGDEYYLVGGLTVPAKTIVTGERKFVYTAWSPNNIRGAGAVVYDTSEPTFISWGDGCEINLCAFHGVDKSRDFLDDGSGGGGFRMFQTDVFRCKFGFGRAAGTGNSRLLQCHFSGNSTGIVGLTDGHVYMCEINANDYAGIRISTGNNATTYIGNKVEWNSTYGFQIYGTNFFNIITGGVIDRNGLAGISVMHEAVLQVSDVLLWRNARFAEDDPSEDCHIRLGGQVKSVQFSNVKTRSGVGDSGEGYNSPASAVVAYANQNEIDSITGCDFTGAVSRVFNLSTGGKLNIKACAGNVMDGLPLSAYYYPTFEKVSATTGVVVVGDVVGREVINQYTVPTEVVFDSLPKLEKYSVKTYEVTISTRASTGTIGTSRLLLLMAREGGGASVYVKDVASTTLSLPVTATASTEGDSMTLTLDPSTGNYKSSVTVTYAS